MRIKYIVPFPVDAEGMAKRRSRIPVEILAPDTDIEFVTARSSGGGSPGQYANLLFDMYSAEAGLSAEEEGFDAVVLDTVSDSGLLALRSRLTIPVVGAGIASYSLASLLGKRFSIVTIWDEWVSQYDQSLDILGMRGRCASIRAAEVDDIERLFAGVLFDDISVFERVTELGQQAIDDDGADVIVLGSTMMFWAGEYMAERLPCPVVNPVPAAVKLAEALVQLRLSHSKVAFPSPRVLQDEKFASLASAASSFA